MLRCKTEDSKDWFHQAEEDMRWLRTWSESDPPFKGADIPEESLRTVCTEYMRENAGPWKAMIKRAGKKAELQTQLKFEYDIWQTLALGRPEEKDARAITREKG